MSERRGLLELEKVSFVDGDRQVLDRVDLVVHEGETVGLTFAQAHGGKTTLLYIAAGLRAPTSGTVRFAGERLVSDGRREQKQELAFVFRDDGGLFPNLTIVDNVSLPLRYHDVPEEEAEARALEALTEVGLASVAQRFTWELTRERMRLAALARALVYTPRLVLIDDFFAGPDETAFELSLRTIARAKAEHGTAFLLVIEPGEATGLDRTVHLDRGHVVTSGTRG